MYQANTWTKTERWQAYMYERRSDAGVVRPIDGDTKPEDWK